MIRTIAVSTALAALIVTGVLFVFAGPRRGAPAISVEASEGVVVQEIPATAVVERGRPRGAFDPAMSGVCRYSCAVSEPFDEKDLTMQPGVPGGALTQCPVSGVVFVVDGKRPCVAIETGEYVFCCDGCASRFRKEPGRFVSL